MVTFSKMYIFSEPNSFHSKKQMWFIFQTFKVQYFAFSTIPFLQRYFEGKWFIFLFWCEPQIVTFRNYTFSWTTFFLLQEINVVHISDVVRLIFCLSNDTTFITILKQKVVQFFVKCKPHIVTFLKKIFNLFSWTTLVCLKETNVVHISYMDCQIPWLSNKTILVMMAHVKVVFFLP